MSILSRLRKHKKETSQLTTISSAGITQRILQRWSADRTGAPLKPAPIDWAHWHRNNPKPIQKRIAGYLK